MTSYQINSLYSAEARTPNYRHRIIITGASSGIGLSAARMLAMKGAHVIMACRNLKKARPLAKEINADAGAAGGKATALHLDTTDLDSIDAFAKGLRIRRLDSLILNAGIMAVPYREVRTRSNKHPTMESQMACNVVGHFYLIHALTGLLRASPGVRVVTVSSLAAGQTKKADSISYDVFTGQSPARYNPMSAYGESKLGDLLLAHELNTRMKRAGIHALAVPMHPGAAKTALVEASAGFMIKALTKVMRGIMMDADGGGLILAVAGALPEERLPVNAYFAPKGKMGTKGPPYAGAKIPAQGRDGAQSAKLWEMCEELCGVRTTI